MSAFVPKAASQNDSVIKLGRCDVCIFPPDGLNNSQPRLNASLLFIDSYVELLPKFHFRVPYAFQILDRIS